MYVSAVSAVLYGNDDVHIGYHWWAADTASAAAAGRHDDGDAEEQFQFAPARHLLPHLCRALFVLHTVNSDKIC